MRYTKADPNILYNNTKKREIKRKKKRKILRVSGLILLTHRRGLRICIKNIKNYSKWRRQIISIKDACLLLGRPQIISSLVFFFILLPKLGFTFFLFLQRKYGRLIMGETAKMVNNEYSHTHSHIYQLHSNIKAQLGKF